MPHRTLGIWVGMVGLLVLGALLLLGRNLEEAATSGPRWKRRLVAAGLAVLTAFGMVPSCKKPSNTSAKPERHLSPKSRRQARETTAWQDLVEIYHRAESVASGKKGPYPFDKKGKAKLLAALDGAMDKAKKLASSGRITPAESDLLVTELTLLKTKVNAFRPTEMKMATCYEPGRLRPYDETKERIEKRMAALERLARQGKIQPRILELVRKRIEQDMAKAEKYSSNRGLSSQDKSLFARAKKLWTSLKRRITAKPR